MNLCALFATHEKGLIMAYEPRDSRKLYNDSRDPVDLVDSRDSIDSADSINHEVRDISNTEKETTITTTTKNESPWTSGMSGILIAILAAMMVFAAYALYANGKNAPIFSSATATSAITSSKDAIAEVPQAIKDSTTKGDQDTTRPNKDGTTNQLDQKPAN